MKTWTLGLGAIAVLLAILAWADPGKKLADRISTFEECTEAGNPTMETYPRKCRATDGTVYMETVVAEETCLRAPSYGDYLISRVYDGTVAEPRLIAGTPAYTFRGAIRSEVAANGVNFGGRYSVASWGCGTACQSSAVVDAGTGEILKFGVSSAYGLGIRATSSLLIVNPPSHFEEQETDILERLVTIEYYEWRDGDLHFICRNRTSGN